MTTKKRNLPPVYNQVSGQEKNLDFVSCVPIASCIYGLVAGFVFHAGTDLMMLSRLTSNLRYSCLSLLSSRIAGVCHQIQHYHTALVLP